MPVAIDTEAVIRLIKESKKKTETRLFISGRLNEINWGAADAQGLRIVRGADFATLRGDRGALIAFVQRWKNFIDGYELEPVPFRNSAVPMADLSQYDARIEPGALIRDMVEIGQGAVIMMGAVINIGASIGERTMIDMNTVIGGRAQIGAKCHIGAGAVVAGVIEPASAQPTVVADEAFIGANAVLLEGVRVGKKAVVAAGAVVTADVPDGAVAAGSPARVIKMADAGTEEKTALVDGLRSL